MTKVHSPFFGWESVGPGVEFEARDLAPVATKENIIPLLREALSKPSSLEVRLTPRSRKHAFIDMQTVNAIITVHDNLRPENQQKFLDTTGGNPVKMGSMAWKLIGKQGG